MNMSSFSASASVSVCPGDAWHSLTFTQGPIHASDYKPVNQWSKDDFLTYLRATVIPRATLSLAFLALSVCVLLIFLLWRLVRCSCIKCGRRCRGTLVAHEVLRRRSMLAVKLFGFFICLGIAGVAIYGLTAPKSNTVQDGWHVVAQIRGYAQKIVDALNTVVLQLQLAQGQISTGLQTLPNLNQTLSIRTQLTAAQAMTKGIIASMMNGISRLRADVIVSIDNASKQEEASTLAAWDNAIKASMGVFAAAILVMLIVGVAAALSCGWGIAIAATLQVLLSCVYFALAAIFAIGMVMLSDYCHNAETIVIQVAPPGQLQGLVSFYINPNSDPSQASVEFQLATANLVNASQVRNLINGPINQTASQLQSLLPLIPTSYKAQVQVLAANLTLTIQSIVSAVGAVGSASSGSPLPSGALGLANLDAVQPLYSSTKAYLCCAVPGLADDLWTLFTVLGWLGLALSVSAMLVLGSLDRTHNSGACCSCTCLRVSELPPAGKPVDVFSPTSAAAAGDLRSRQYLAAQQLEWLRQASQAGEPLVEVRVGGRSTRAGIANAAARPSSSPGAGQRTPTASSSAQDVTGVRSWLDGGDGARPMTAPPGQTPVPSRFQQASSFNNLPRVANH